MKRIAIAVALTIASSNAAASLTTYKLYDVTFSDGGVATGTFVVDSEFGLRQATQIDITTTAASAREYSVTYNQNAEITYEPEVPIAIGLADALNIYTYLDDGSLAYWNMSYGADTSANYSWPSGSTPLTSFLTAPTIYGSYRESTRNAYLVSGYFAPVPLPATAWLFGSAIAGLVWSKKTWKR